MYLWKNNEIIEWKGGGILKVFELSAKVYLTDNISADTMMGKIAKLIDNTLSITEEYLEFHKANYYKGYTFDGFYRVEPDGIYKEGRIYNFRIRTIDEKLALYLEEKLTNNYTDEIKVLTVVKRVVPKKHIEKIYAITPVIIKNDEGYWRTHMNFDEYEHRLVVNLIKNYNFFTGEKIDENFEMFKYIKFDNKKPIAVSYKDKISLLGDKITAFVSENEKAQKLAYLALGVGLGENSSRGCGFCGYKYL